MGPRHIAMS